MGVERGAIDLKTREARSVTRAQLYTIIKRLLRMLRKPQAQSLFGQMMMSEVMSQSEDPRHVATADLGGRFAYFAIELGRLLDNQNSGVRTATFEHERCRSARKRAADDRHIVIHGEKMMRALAGKGNLRDSTQNEATFKLAPRDSSASLGMTV
jgi:hypothetical protein